VPTGRVAEAMCRGFPILILLSFTVPFPFMLEVALLLRTEGVIWVSFLASFALSLASCVRWPFFLLLLLQSVHLPSLVDSIELNTFEIFRYM